MKESSPQQTGRRAQQIEERKALLIQAAQALFRKHGIDNVTGEQIAERAGFSTPTLYNLIGKRDELVLELLRNMVRELRVRVAEEPTRNPLKKAEAAVLHSIDIYLKDERLYRELLLHAGGLGGIGRQEGYPTAIDLQISAMIEAQKAGLLVKGFSAEAIGRQVYISFIGAMLEWAHENITNEQFSALAQHGFYLAVAGVCAEDVRPVVLRKLKQQARILES